MIAAGARPEIRIAPRRAWEYPAYACAIVLALGVGYFVFRIPVQVTDCLANLIQVQGQSWVQSVTAGVGAGYMRPLLWAQIKVMYELASGEYTVLFRSIHVAQVLACALLFVAALRVRDVAGALVVPFGLATLFAAHTFYGTVVEAFPINSFLSVVIGVLATVTLSLGEPRRWHDAAATVLVVVLMLTVESGVLVWFCLIAAAAVGGRGVSRRAVIVTTAFLAVYVLARFAILDVGTPGLIERSSGFGFRALDPRELQARFGAAPWLFYGYNVASQLLTVLFGEPSGGIWAVTRDWQGDRLAPGQVIRLVSSTGATLLIAGFVVSRFGRWRLRLFEHDDRVVIVFIAVLLANALVSFPYTKDVIMSPAGALHALASATALRALLRRLAVAAVPTMAAASLLIAIVTTGATVRLFGLCYLLRDASFVTRNEWTEFEAWAERNRVDLRPAPRAALAMKLRQDAIAHRVPSPTFANPGWSRYVY